MHTLLKTIFKFCTYHNTFIYIYMNNAFNNVLIIETNKIFLNDSNILKFLKRDHVSILSHQRIVSVKYLRNSNFEL